MMSGRESMDRDVWLAARNRVLIPGVSRAETMPIQYPRSSPIDRRKVSHTAPLSQLHKLRVILIVFLFFLSHIKTAIIATPPIPYSLAAAKACWSIFQGECSAVANILLLRDQ